MPTSREGRRSAFGVPLALVGAMLLSVTACDDLVGTAPHIQWTSSLELLSTDQSQLAPLSTSVVVDERNITVAGRVVTGATCQDVDLRARTQGQVIELYVRIAAVQNGCRPLNREFAYTLAADHPRGEYRVITRHETVLRDGTKFIHVATDTIVVVE